MSFQHLPSPTPSGSRPTESKRPHLSVFRFTSCQSTSRTPSHTPPAYSSSDVLAERNYLHAKILHWMRIALALITLVVSLIITAFAGNVLRIYTKTRYNSTAWILPLWPAAVDMRPAHAVLACGIILAIFSLIYLVCAFAPTPLRALRPLNFASTLLAFLSLFTTIFTTAYSTTINNHLSNNIQAGTLASWTCKWQDFSSVAPGRFSDICVQSTAALDLVILMIVVEVLYVVLSGWGWWVGVKVKREERRDGKEGIHLGA
ncbi:MAG: hypothetical protein Q9201_003834 [Fulgogasparrea decipioides]